MIEALKKIWSVFTPAERRKGRWMLVLVVLMALAETASVLSIMPFLSVLGRPSVIQDSPTLSRIYQSLGMVDTRQLIFALGLASIVLVVSSSLFKTVTLHVLNRFVHLERHSISTRLLSRYLQQPYEFFLVNNPSILARNVLSEVDQLLYELIQPVSQLIAQGSVLLAMTVLIFCYDATTALCITAALAILYGTIYSLVRKRLARIGAERQRADGQRYQACNEALGGIKDVKVTHATNAYIGHFERASRLFSRHFATNETLAQSPLYLVEATGYTGLIIIALVLLNRTNDVAHVLPALGLYGFAAYRMLPSAQIMYRGFAKLRFTSSTLDAIAQDLQLPPEAPAAATSTLPLRHEIRLSGISYAYPSTPDKRILDGLDLVIPANSSVGIVGKSGAGKSTLMDILLGLLRPLEGTMTVDGTPISEANVARWQHTIGYVPQHIYLSDASVAENIAFGLPREAIDMAAVERAARAAQIHDFVVHELPQGYETQVGDRGIRLSGGQRQRVGIARALYRDPPVLLMDEATSALDTETEEALIDSIRALCERKTIIVIAHREASLHFCRQVIAINQKPRFSWSPPC
ncbi:MAG: ABC transporter ATP-binding protein [Lysobacterales bacterium 14-68-21]|jgi:ABC-type multidrug transport system fused ATPase/permease subunit|nr:MAG: ABC transporter ATP-binding protein [Xanthomonadales bacterium 15-68-25]OZB68001.1 MAG: ABC transporter ATP-binding protein [Xanthomonadales bacterium 14-68-21]